MNKQNNGMKNSGLMNYYKINKIATKMPRNMYFGSRTQYWKAAVQQRLESRNKNLWHLHKY